MKESDILLLQQTIDMLREVGIINDAYMLSWHIGELERMRHAEHTPHQLRPILLQIAAAAMLALDGTYSDDVL